MQKQLLGATAKQRAVLNALMARPHEADRLNARQVGASHTLVGRMRKLYGARALERQGDDGVFRRLPLPKKPDRKRWEKEIAESANELVRVLDAALEVYRYTAPDPHLIDTIRIARHLVAWRLDEAEETIGGQPIKPVGKSFGLLLLPSDDGKKLPDCFHETRKSQ